MKSPFRSGLVSRRSPEIVPALGTLLLLTIAALQIAMPSSADLPEYSGGVPHLKPDPQLPAMNKYDAILQRPIFAPDRASILLQAQASGNLNGYEVLGTAVAGTVSAALVRDATGRIIRIKPDAILQGWRLISVDRTQLVFDRDGERRSLMVSAVAPVRPAGSTQLGSSSQSHSDDSDDSDDSDNSSNSDDDNDN